MRFDFAQPTKMKEKAKIRKGSRYLSREIAASNVKRSKGIRKKNHVPELNFVGGLMI